MHIDHINISAPAELLEKVRNFYCDVLDLTEGSRPKFSSNGYWLYSEGEAIVHLSESSDRNGGEKQGYFDHFALQTAELLFIIERLNEYGVEYRKVHLPEIGLSQLFFKDPVGTGVEVQCLDKAI